MIFSKVGIRSCTVKIGNDFNENCKQMNANLYVVPWDPTIYREGLHYMTVTVIDNDSRENQVVQPFRFDEKQSLHFDPIALFVLYTDATLIFKSVFWFSLFLCVSPLIFFRIWHELVKAGTVRRMRGSCRGAMSIVQHYWLVSAVDRIFWPVVLYCFYLAFGPWVFCDIVDGHYGIVFAWGIYLDGAFLPGSLTYLYGASQLLFCQFPLNWVFSRCLAKRYFEVLKMPAKSHRGWWKKFFRALFYLIMTVEVALAIFFGLLYGALAFLLGVSRTWSVVMNLYLYYLARNVPDNALR